MNKKKNQEKLRSMIQGHIPLILKCGCGVFHPFDDYPFVKCTTCGWINCGTKEELEEARKNGTLMKTLKWQDLTKEEKELIERKDQEFEDKQTRYWMEEEESLETEIEEDPDYWLDELNSRIDPRNKKQEIIMKRKKRYEKVFMLTFGFIMAFISITPLFLYNEVYTWEIHLTLGFIFLIVFFNIHIFFREKIIEFLER